MTIKAREFIDFWIETSIHAREQYATRGAEQNVLELVHRLVAAAQIQGVTEPDMVEEVGDLKAYIRAKLGEANQAENDRLK